MEPLRFGSVVMMRTIHGADPVEVVWFRASPTAQWFKGVTPFGSRNYKREKGFYGGIGEQGPALQVNGKRDVVWHNGEAPAPYIGDHYDGTPHAARYGATVGVDDIFSTNGIGQPPGCATPYYIANGGPVEGGYAIFAVTAFGGAVEGGRAAFPLITMGGAVEGGQVAFPMIPMGGQVEGGQAVFPFVSVGGEVEGGQAAFPLVAMGGEVEGGQAYNLFTAVGGAVEGGQAFNALIADGGSVEGGQAAFPLTADGGAVEGGQAYLLFTADGGAVEGGQAAFPLTADGGAVEGGQALTGYVMLAVGGEVEGGQAVFPVVSVGGEVEGGQAVFPLVALGGEVEGGHGDFPVAGFGGEVQGGQAVFPVVGLGGEVEGGTAVITFPPAGPTPTYTGCGQCPLTFNNWQVTGSGGTGIFTNLNGTTALPLSFGCQWAHSYGSFSSFNMTFPGGGVANGSFTAPSFAGSASYSGTLNCTGSMTLTKTGQSGSGTAPTTLTIDPVS